MPKFTVEFAAEFCYNFFVRVASTCLMRMLKYELQILKIAIYILQELILI